MFYTPKFCNECGDKIDHGERRLWDGRRFCEICDESFPAQKWLPRLFAGLGVLSLIFGAGSYLKKSDKPLNVLTTQTNLLASNKNQNAPGPEKALVSANPNAPAANQKQLAATEPIEQANVQTPSPQQLLPLAGNQKTGPAKPNLTDARQNSATEAVYFCGAQTKKGTPCTRRVKGGGRCWQHLGQPAMLPPEKLIAVSGGR